MHAIAAAYSGHARCAQLLRRAGADAGVIDANGQKPHHMSMLQGHAELAHQLARAAGDDIGNGQHAAAGSGSEDGDEDQQAVRSAEETNLTLNSGIDGLDTQSMSESNETEKAAAQNRVRLTPDERAEVRAAAAAVDKNPKRFCLKVVVATVCLLMLLGAPITLLILALAGDVL
eukprot:SAG31_NODE_3546_length_4100_cov_3.507182_4_plen_174_part_00